MDPVIGYDNTAHLRICVYSGYKIDALNLVDMGIIYENETLKKWVKERRMERQKLGRQIMEKHLKLGGGIEKILDDYIS